MAQPQIYSHPGYWGINKIRSFTKWNKFSASFMFCYWLLGLNWLLLLLLFSCQRKFQFDIFSAVIYMFKLQKKKHKKFNSALSFPYCTIRLKNCCFLFQGMQRDVHLSCMRSKVARTLPLWPCWTPSSGYRQPRTRRTWTKLSWWACCTRLVPVWTILLYTCCAVTTPAASRGPVRNISTRYCGSVIQTKTLPICPFENPSTHNFGSVKG